jgi:CubicO group peptidase (beta-lactamase class C family)
MMFPGATWETGQMTGSVDGGAVEAEIAAQFSDANRFATTLAMVVVHEGRVVAERYADSVTPTTPLISWSMAKSITDALVGMCVADGLVDLHDPAPIPEWMHDGRSQITLEHLMQMRSGLRWVEDYVDGETSDVIAMLFGVGKDDHARYAIDCPLEHEPGSTWVYSSGTTNIICRIVADALGEAPGSHDKIDGLLARLFDTLGMVAEPRFDAAGTFVGSSFVYASARDFARFGTLYLHDGTWNDTRLLPRGWVDHARACHVVDAESGLGYGSQWWTLPEEPDALVASGYEGQHIVVCPSRDLVVVRLGKTPADLRANVLASLRAVISSFPATGGRA